MANFNARVNPRSGKRQRLAVGASAVQFAAANYTIGGGERNPQKLASAATLQVFGDDIYWTIDGSTPSSTVGFLALDGEFIYLQTYQQLREFRAIQVTGAASVEGLFSFE